MFLVALTGWGMEVDRARSREAGFDTHMVKPVNHDALVKLLASHGHRAEKSGGLSPLGVSPD